MPINILVEKENYFQTGINYNFLSRINLGMSLCIKGKKQSPISIDPDHITPCDDIENCKLSFYYRNSIGSISNINDNIFIL